MRGRLTPRVLRIRARESAKRALLFARSYNLRNTHRAGRPGNRAVEENVIGSYWLFSMQYTTE